MLERQRRPPRELLKDSACGVNRRLARVRVPWVLERPAEECPMNDQHCERTVSLRPAPRKERNALLCWTDIVQ